MKVSFISLGCAKNLVNTEQMMALCRDAGITLQDEQSGADVVVYGHSHRYAMEEREGVLWLNPGSCGRRRFDQEITFAMMTAEKGRYQVEKVIIPNEVK